jgi:hypothetical protein
MCHCRTHAILLIDQQTWKDRSANLEKQCGRTHAKNNHMLASSNPLCASIILQRQNPAHAKDVVQL